ncbi:heterokaryon incompatibility domain-containing protein [Trichoderma evansii]
MPQPYVFSDLKAPKNFRLMTILPGEYKEPLQCTICEYQSQEALSYEALSYAWGASRGQDESHPTMSLNQQEFTISSTLEQTLRRLRKQNTERVIAQVAIMPNIYRGAVRVIAWIGEKSYDSDHALLFLKEMAMHHKYSLRHWWRNGVRLGSDTSSECGEGKYVDEETDDRRSISFIDNTQSELPTLDEKETNEMKGISRNSRQADWEAVDNLLARLWCSRTWVVQEIWQAKDAILVCDDSTIKRKTFKKAMEYQEAWDDMGCLVRGTKRWETWTTLKSRYGLAIHISQKRLLGSKLSDILWNTWDRDATDPRDKVFAILGLVGKDYIDTLPNIDYSKSIEEVYREVTSLIITKEKSLDILLAASGPDNGETLPSWVPDWRKKANKHRPALFINASFMRMQCYHSGSTDAVYFHGHGYPASGDMGPQVIFHNDINMLQVRAVMFDSISEVSANFGNDLSAANIIEQARITLSNSRPGGSSSLNTRTSDGELKKIVSAGSFIDPRSVFSITNDGYLSIGPSRLQAGDLISIIAGCSFPMILRSVGNYFSLVGEAYSKINTPSMFMVY